MKNAPAWVYDGCMRTGCMLIPKIRTSKETLLAQSGILLGLKKNMCRVLWSDGGVTQIPIALIQYYWEEAE